MTSDPLSLNAVKTPEAMRLQRAAPHPYVSALYKRITTSTCADSLEAKVAFLAHLVFYMYQDLKDSQTQ